MFTLKVMHVFKTNTFAVSTLLFQSILIVLFKENKKTWFIIIGQVFKIVIKELSFLWSEKYTDTSVWIYPAGFISVASLHVDLIRVSCCSFYRESLLNLEYKQSNKPIGGISMRSGARFVDQRTSGIFLLRQLTPLFVIELRIRQPETKPRNITAV